MSPAQIRDLGCWPPRSFMNERKKVAVQPPVPGRLVMISIDYATRGDSEVVLGLYDPVTRQRCTARLAVRDVSMALRVYQTLRTCEKTTIDEMGTRLIAEM
jgi:hypothetical protein